MKQYTNHQGRVVGGLYDDGVFRKRVKGSIHRYKNEDGWGIDTVILNQLPEGTEIRIQDTEENVVYITTLEVFKSGSKVDFGHGEQLILWRDFFDTVKDGVRTKSPEVGRWMADYEMFLAYPNI